MPEWMLWQVRFWNCVHDQFVPFIWQTLHRLVPKLCIYDLVSLCVYLNYFTGPMQVEIWVMLPHESQLSQSSTTQPNESSGMEVFLQSNDRTLFRSCIFFSVYTPVVQFHGTTTVQLKGPDTQLTSPQKTTEGSRLPITQAASSHHKHPKNFIPCQKPWGWPPHLAHQLKCTNRTKDWWTLNTTFEISHV